MGPTVIRPFIHLRRRAVLHKPEDLFASLYSPCITCIILCCPRVCTEHLLFSVANRIWIFWLRHCLWQRNALFVGHNIAIGC
jgi:hypothetical protein